MRCGVWRYSAGRLFVCSAEYDGGDDGVGMVLLLGVLEYSAWKGLWVWEKVVGEIPVLGWRSRISCWGLLIGSKLEC